jgi:hypothetical protein
LCLEQGKRAEETMTDLLELYYQIIVVPPAFVVALVLLALGWALKDKLTGG